VVVPVAVYVVDHGAEGRGLARARRARDEDEPLREEAEVEDRAREPELLGRDDVARDLAEDAAHPRPVAEEVAAEAGPRPELVGEVGVARLLELLLVRV